MGMMVAALVLFMFTITIEKTEGYCCHMWNGWCGDCTRPTPYCAHRPCNLFGCDCKGECRTGCSISWWGKCNCGTGRKRRSIAVPKVDPKDIFNQYDSDKDGKIDKDEFHNGFDETDLTDRELDQQFENMDEDGNGFITIDEMDHEVFKG